MQLPGVIAGARSGERACDTRVRHNTAAVGKEHENETP